MLLAGGERLGRQASAGGLWDSAAKGFGKEMHLMPQRGSRGLGVRQIPDMGHHLQPQGLVIRGFSAEEADQVLHRPSDTVQRIVVT